MTNEAEMLITAMENEAKAMQLDLSVAAVLFEKSKSPYAGGSFLYFSCVPPPSVFDLLSLDGVVCNLSKLPCI